jgi:DNA-binding MarR family transcriptional regulator
MSSKTPEQAGAARARRRLTNTVKETLRELSNQLSLLNHNVSSKVEIRSIDLDCLDIVVRHGPLSPTALARRAGLHPATVTGILDRLQRGGWVTRERDPDAADRRAVTVRALPDRGGELFRMYGGMNARLDELCADYTDAELELIAGFLRRTTDAGYQAVEQITSE